MELPRQLRTFRQDYLDPDVEAVTRRTLDQCREDVLHCPQRIPEAIYRIEQPHLAVDRLYFLFVCDGLDRPISFPVCCMDFSGCLHVTCTSDGKPRYSGPILTSMFSKVRYSLLAFAATYSYVGQTISSPSREGLCASVHLYVLSFEIVVAPSK